MSTQASERLAGIEALLAHPADAIREALYLEEDLDSLRDGLDAVHVLHERLGLGSVNPKVTMELQRLTGILSKQQKDITEKLAPADKETLDRLHEGKRTQAEARETDFNHLIATGIRHRNDTDWYRD